MSASAIVSLSLSSLMTTGTWESPAIRAARQRRSPATSW